MCRRSDGYWAIRLGGGRVSLNLQVRYDLEVERGRLGNRLEQEVVALS
jgi:hypothetical protein